MSAQYLYIYIYTYELGNDSIISMEKDRRLLYIHSHSEFRRKDRLSQIGPKDHLIFVYLFVVIMLSLADRIQTNWTINKISIYLKIKETQNFVC